MAALISCILSWIKGPNYQTIRHALNLTFPPIMHRVLEESYVSHFKEVFVIGDVHGCYDELMELLKKADVTSHETLKLYVGDLVRKGPKSCEVLNLLKNSPSMLSVRGNHDEIALVDYYKSKEPGYEMDDRNKWILDLNSDDINLLNNLPYTISIPSLNAIIVHGGLMPGVQLSQNDPVEMVTMRNLILSDPFWDSGLKASKYDKEGVPWASLWPGPTHVYFGHDAKRQLQKYEYATGLDTGCAYGNSLTGVFISGPRKGTFVSVNAMKVYRVPGVIARAKENVNPEK